MTLTLPRPPHSLVIATEALVGVLLAIGFGAAAMLPVASTAVAEELPEYADLRVPLLVAGFALLTLGLLALGSVASLVHRIHRGSMLVSSSLVWVDLLAGALAAAAVVIVAASAVISNGEAGSPFLLIIEVMAVLGLMAVAGVTLVLRSLLRSAIDMRAELEAVV